VIDQLFGLFDAMAPLSAEVTLWEEDNPGADYAARLWASSKPGYSVLDVHHDAMKLHVTRICKDGCTRILVYRNDPKCAHGLIEVLATKPRSLEGAVRRCALCKEVQP